MSSRYWFAVLSRTGVGNPRMSPVSSEGWLVVAGFVASMFVGALLFVWLMIADHPAAGVILFVLFAVVGAGGFLWASVARGDKARTVAEYRAMRSGGTMSANPS
ncbi:MAG: hypothetical protein WDM94_08185 [Bauldia sp.]